MSRIRRPWTRLASVALAGHVYSELPAGVGMPFASVLGPAPAAAACSTGTGWVQRAAGSSSGTPHSPSSTARAWAAVAHLADWPRRRTGLGLPCLIDCEGLGFLG